MHKYREDATGRLNKGNKGKNPSYTSIAYLNGTTAHNTNVNGLSTTVGVKFEAHRSIHRLEIINDYLHLIYDRGEINNYEYDSNVSLTENVFYSDYYFNTYAFQASGNLKLETRNNRYEVYVINGLRASTSTTGADCDAALYGYVINNDDGSFEPGTIFS